MKQNFSFLLIYLSFISCGKNDSEMIVPNTTPSQLISAVDISNYPEITKQNVLFYDSQGVQNTFLNILKQSGVNTIRLRLWVHPANEHSSFEEVKQFSEELKSKGFQIWLSLHYSDTWADPGQQITPFL